MNEKHKKKIIKLLNDLVPNSTRKKSECKKNDNQKQKSEINQY